MPATNMKQTGVILDFMPHLQRKLEKNREVEAPGAGTASPLSDGIGNLVLMCETDLRVKGAFVTFAEKYKPKALFDLRPSQALAFLTGSQAWTFDLFKSLGIRYFDVSGRVSCDSFSPEYWTSDELAETLAELLVEFPTNESTSICLFGSPAQLRTGRPTVQRAVERDLSRQHQTPISLYRSGLLAI